MDGTPVAMDEPNIARPYTISLEMANLVEMTAMEYHKVANEWCCESDSVRAGPTGSSSSGQASKRHRSSDSASIASSPDRVKRPRFSETYDLSSVQYTFFSEDGATRQVCLSTLLLNRDRRPPTPHYWYDFERFCRLHDLQQSHLEGGKICGSLGDEFMPISDEAGWNLFLCKLQERLQLAYHQGEPLPHPSIGPKALFCVEYADTQVDGCDALSDTLCISQSPAVEILPKTSPPCESTQPGVSEGTIASIPGHSWSTDTCGVSQPAAMPRETAQGPGEVPIMGNQPTEKSGNTSDLDIGANSPQRAGIAPQQSTIDIKIESNASGDDDDLEYCGEICKGDNSKTCKPAVTKEYEIISLISDDEDTTSEDSEDSQDNATCTTSTTIEGTQYDEVETEWDTFARQTSETAVLGMVMRKVAGDYEKTEEDWIKCCKLLKHPVSLRGANEGKMLWGSRRRLSPQQMMMIYRTVEGVVNGTRHGLIIGADANEEGPLGKLGIALYHRLSFMNKHHRDLYPEQHRVPRDGGRPNCPIDNPFGIECVCALNSMTRKFVERVTEGSMMLILPPALIPLWEKETQSYFLPFITSPLVIEENGKPRPVKVDGCMAKFEADDIKANVTVSGKLTGVQVQRLDRNPDCDVRTLGGLRINMSPRLDKDQTKFILFVSTASLIQPRASQIWGQTVSVSRKGGDTSFGRVRWAIMPSYCGVADCNMPEQHRDSLMEYLAMVKGDRSARKNSSPRPTMTVMSHMPLRRDSGGIRSLFKLLCPERILDTTISTLTKHSGNFTALQEFRDGLIEERRISTRARADLMSGIERFVNYFANFLSTWMLVRTDGGIFPRSAVTAASGNSLMHISKDNFPLDEIYEKEIGILRESVREGIREKSSHRKGFMSERTMVAIPGFDSLCAVELLPPLIHLVRQRESPIEAKESEGRLRELPSFSSDQVNAFDCPQLRFLGQILRKASGRGDRRKSNINRAGMVNHVVIFVDWLPHETMAVMTAWISTRLRKEAVVACIHPDLDASQKDAVAGELALLAKEFSRARSRSLVVITTHDLMGVEWDKLTFANYYVQWGEPRESMATQQALARIFRGEQRQPVHDIRIHATRVDSAEGGLRALREGRPDLLCQNTILVGWQ